MPDNDLDSKVKDFQARSALLRGNSSFEQINIEENDTTSPLINSGLNTQFMSIPNEPND
jgi:hypothetical protein